MRGLAALIAAGNVTPFTLWRGGRALTAPAQTLAEADRCAEWIQAAWLD